MVENYILFEVADATYAVRTSQVELIEMVDSITRVPNAPDFVEGITAVRGQVIPVISVRRRFHMETIPMDMRARLVITRVDSRLIGMLVDTAREFARITPDQIRPADSLTGPETDYLDGVAVLPNRLILLVNLERLLSFEEREVLTEAAALENEVDTGGSSVEDRIR